MTAIAEVARTWIEAGVSVIPILANGTKRPAVGWALYQKQRAALEQIDQWWDRQDYGMAIICGAVSGSLEMLELEGRAMEPDLMVHLEDIIHETGVGDLWDLLMGPEGYSEWSPSGGLHLLYRVSDREVPGNTKLAGDGGYPIPLVLAETRGEGGYVIAAPTSGRCHPTGDPWVLYKGTYGKLPTITWEQRCLLHKAITVALDSSQVDGQENLPTPAPLATPVHSSPGATGAPPGGAGLSPGDDFEQKVDWYDILTPHGWKLLRTNAHERLWTRPGKHPGEGHSATTGHAGDRDRLYVFSTSTVFRQDTPYTKFGAYAVLNHHGDHSEAAKALVRQGFGDPRLPVSTLDVLELTDSDTQRLYTWDDAGNAMRLWHHVKGQYLYVWDEQTYYQWTGEVWHPDIDGALIREWIRCTERMDREGLEAGSESLIKYARACRAKARIKSACEIMQSLTGVTQRSSDFNPFRHKINVGNGVLDLTAGEFLDHAPEFYMTRIMGASYIPEAGCPNFDRFIVDILPDETLRRYVQRAIGYTLLGNADERAIFLAHGPTGTGKSQFVEVMRMVFGGYATTAPPGTFHASPNGKIPSDLHELKGKRFVATSETADSAIFDENLIKRITGRDSQKSRELYQRFQEWTAECSVWFTTNFPPRFSSDDDAIWRRAKLIPFTTQFGRDGIHEDIKDFARTQLASEVDGILNWVLAGVADYLAHGLDEPEVIKEAGRGHRIQSDPVMRFLDDLVADGILILDPAEDLRPSELYHMYEAWCRSSGERALGNRRFLHRIQSSDLGITHERQHGSAWLHGVGRASGAGILGTML